jgi:hypothetical protein
MKRPVLVLMTTPVLAVTALLYVTGPSTKTVTTHYNARAYCMTELSDSRRSCPDIGGTSMWRDGGDAAYRTEVKTTAWERISGAIAGRSSTK